MPNTYCSLVTNERELFIFCERQQGKGLHQATLQDITFKYNIRGWLTHINELENVQLGNPEKLFAFQIYYDEASQFNGNIGKVEWKTTTDAVQRGYEFDYDKLNRLKKASYFNDGTSRYEEDYTVSNITYDHNGNIQTLARNGLLYMERTEDPQNPIKKYGQIDDLSYSYVSSMRGASHIKSNRLMDVTDNAGQNSGIAGDFQDRMRGSFSDYSYDKNGNLLVDNNKGIYKIIYNHLNLPERIVFERGNEILNTYDAAGIKLKSEIVENGVPLRTTHYKNGFIYEQKSTDPELKLSFFGTTEGRIVKKERTFVYEYHYKDHLGNLRVAFQAQEDQERERYSLTMEADSSKKEEAEFENVAAARSDQKDKEGHYSAELENSKQPISKTIKVKKGDQIKASVFATHDPAIAETDPTKAIAEAKKDVLLSLGGVVAGSINPTPIEQKIEIPLNPEISPAHTITIKSPKVQLNLLDFIPVIRNLRALNKAKNAKGLEPDMYFVPKGELVLELRDSTDSLIFEKREKLTISSAVSWEKLVSNLAISQDGNLSVYIDNSSSDKVYFDEFIIERTEATVAVVVQENHYYPFGMNMKGIEELDLQSIDGSDEHRFQYNGKEKEESFGLYWNDHRARNMDLQLGRWWGVDPLAEKFVSTSSYVAMVNNPVRFVDLDGKQAGEYFDQLGNSLGTDGIADQKIYVVTDAKDVENAKVATSKKEKLNVTKISSAILMPSEHVRSEMGEAVERSNNPSPQAEDAVGGLHEEGGYYGKNGNGQEVVIDSKPGAAYVKGEASGAGVNPLDPGTQHDANNEWRKKDKIEGTFHVHPKGDAASGVAFVQPPSNADLRNSNNRYAIGITGNHFVLASGNNTVYIYHKGQVLATFPLNQFISIKTK